MQFFSIKYVICHQRKHPRASTLTETSNIQHLSPTFSIFCRTQELLQSEKSTTKPVNSRYFSSVEYHQGLYMKTSTSHSLQFAQVFFCEICRNLILSLRRPNLYGLSQLCPRHLTLMYPQGYQIFHRNIETAKASP